MPTIATATKPGSRNANDKDADRVHHGNFASNLEFLSRVRPIRKQAKLLEIGSGTGSMLAHLCEQGYDAVGIEINQDQVDRALAAHPGLPIQLADGGLIPFEDNSFDVVASFDVFEHIPDSDVHLGEVARVLKPGGRYLLQSPNKWTNSIFETIRWKSLTKWREDHCSLHSYFQFKRRFKKHNFDITFVEVPIVTDYFLKKIKLYLGRPGVAAVKVAQPDRWPKPMRTNFYIEATLRG
ncbi:MAG TPA: class I SAM-dependent methyltransferase [Phycisphaerales bacterium]|nr:class I SAM-dependent methyltransferase [Phycisphaerales bacterium]